MNEKVLATLKSAETDDWLDIHVVRPICYYWALAFNKLDIHPNTVTILSMIIGAASAYFFARGCYYYEGGDGLAYNLIAVVMLIVADLLDCTDGQLARMSGKTSRMGRILDGAAGFVWFVPIYLALAYRFFLHHDLEFSWLGIENNETNTLIASAIVLVLSFISGFAGISGQQRVADYYIQVHLFFLKGEKGAELDNSQKQRQILAETPKEGNIIWRAFLKSYIGYTEKQEKKTPKFQTLLRTLKQKYGSYDNIPQQVRDTFHDYSLPLIKLNGLLTFNFRTAFFFLFVLLDVPALFFLFEIIGMGLLCEYIVHRHESFCEKINASLISE